MNIDEINFHIECTIGFQTKNETSNEMKNDDNKKKKRPNKQINNNKDVNENGNENNEINENNENKNNMNNQNISSNFINSETQNCNNSYHIDGDSLDIFNIKSDLNVNVKIIEN